MTHADRILAEMVDSTRKLEVALKVIGLAPGEQRAPMLLEVSTMFDNMARILDGLALNCENIQHRSISQQTDRLQ